MQAGRFLIFTRAALISLFVLLTPSASADEDKIQYNRDIRPILSNNCFKCHGFDGDARQAGLRLDTFAGATEAHPDGKQAIAPGDPGASELVARILSTDPNTKMPPPETDRKLSDAEVALLKQWIAEGANYASHWAYQKPEHRELPEVTNRQWPINGLDFFVLQRLEQEGLQPSPEAPAETLLRRVYLDLTGVPPSPEELDAFLADQSTVAYEKVVQRLLDSPRFGERWARPWLDMARFADTKGYEADRRRVIWQYRDWVIRALNADMPYDQFTIEQLAGDLLPEPTRDQLIATAFHRNTMTNDEGGTDNEEFRHAAVVDRVNTTAEVWLGMTMACAQCHTHKYDPITQTEFFQFYAFFNQTADSDQYPVETPVIPTPDPEQEAALKALNDRIALVQRRMQVRLPALHESRAAWERGVLELGDAPLLLGNWHAAGPFPAASFDEAFATAFAPEKEVNLAAPVPIALDATDAATLQWVEHPEWKDGEIQQLEAEIGATYVYRTITSPTAQPVKLSLGSNDSIKLWLNGTELLSNHIGRGAEPDQEQLTVELREGENTLLMKIANAGGGHAFYFRVAETGHPEEIVAIVKTAPEQRSAEQQQQLDAFFASIAPELEPFRAEQVKVQAEKDALLAQIPTVPVLQELPADQQRETRLHIGGSFLNPGDPVSPGVPGILHAMDPEAPRNRLGLARWLMDPDNPLTARVAVNRFWGEIFGTGIVETAEDFGTQGELPTHPALLDWLALEFQDRGWSVKELLRLIVTSAAYRQDSVVRPELQETDSNNRLLARGPRFRLSAEFLRDQALAVSGLLSNKMYGPSVMPPQPDRVWMVVYSNDKWITGEGEDRYRRGLYTFWRRTSPYPSMITFDATSREVCTVRRSRTNTPLQALVMLNDPVYIEAAQALARRTLASGGAAFEERLSYAYRAALARNPRPEEVSALRKLCEKAMAEYQADAAAALEMAANPLGPLPETLDSAESAAWTVLCNVILNLDEFLTKT